MGAHAAVRARTVSSGAGVPVDASPASRSGDSGKHPDGCDDAPSLIGRACGIASACEPASSRCIGLDRRSSTEVRCRSARLRLPGRLSVRPLLTRPSAIADPPRGADSSHHIWRRLPPPAPMNRERTRSESRAARGDRGRRGRQDRDRRRSGAPPAAPNLRPRAVNMSTGGGAARLQRARASGSLGADPDRRRGHGARRAASVSKRRRWRARWFGFGSDGSGKLRPRRHCGETELPASYLSGRQFPGTAAEPSSSPPR
jgi:hypothetical protein